MANNEDVLKGSGVLDDGEEILKGMGARRPAAGGGTVIAQHAVVGGDMLGAISLQYYGSATKAYWTVIYDANKALIGENPNKLKRGIILNIPELPAELEMKK